mmetsp:Transcript_13101/g.22113  ORF Transcript_13101/g.22113 Transcript_13101/m.22113 type:complete len:98 (+) Transcript_13101:1401-1694(+)
MFVSILYDFFWLFFLQEMEREGAAAEGGLEASVKSFAITVSYVQFMFKIVVFFVLWKVSYNYLLDIKSVYEAPRIVKIMKIIEQFSPEIDLPQQQYD